MMTRSNRKSVRTSLHVKELAPRMEWKSDGIGCTNAVDAAAALERLLNSRTAENYRLVSVITSTSVDGLVVLFHRVAEEVQDDSKTSTQQNAN